MTSFPKLAIIAALGLTASGAWAQTLNAELVIGAGLERPVLVTHAPNDFTRIFVLEKRGRIRVIDITTDPPTLLPTAFLDIDALVTGGTSDNDERGLLGLAFHPDYAGNGLFYVYYTGARPNGNPGLSDIVARYSVSANPNVADAGSAQLVINANDPQDNHNGGWIAFGPNDGYLYIAIGDGGNFNDQGSGHSEPGGNAQNIERLLGKMLRVDINGDDFPDDAVLNYAIPADNPFVGRDGRDELWAYGLRNPWRDSFDRETGDLWIADVGQDMWEEINFQPVQGAVAGRNYGWRCREGRHNFNIDSVCMGQIFVDPIHEYSHTQGCSITGGYVYRGCAIPDLRGTYFFSDFCSARIWSFRYDGTTMTEFMDRTTDLDPPGALSINAVASFGEDAFGEMYICDQGGEIFKIVPQTFVGPDCNTNNVRDDCEILANPALDANQNGVLDSCEPPGCTGDVNGDGITDLADLATLLSNFGATGATRAQGDLDANTVVDLSDLAILLSDFGCD